MAKKPTDRQRDFRCVLPITALIMAGTFGCMRPAQRTSPSSLRLPPSSLNSSLTSASRLQLLVFNIGPKIPVVGQPAEAIAQFYNSYALPLSQVKTEVIISPTASATWAPSPCAKNLAANSGCSIVGQILFTSSGTYQFHATFTPIDTSGTVLPPLVSTLTVQVVEQPSFNAKVQMLAPRGGEQWTRGGTVTLKWMTDAPKVTLFLRKNGALLRSIADELPRAQQEYDWLIPSDLQLDAKYSIEAIVYTADGHTPMIRNESPPFSLKADKSIRVLRPGMRESWAAGQKNRVTIEWEGACSNEYAFADLLKGTQHVETLIVPVVTSTATAACFRVIRHRVSAEPPPSWLAGGRNYRIRITSVDGSSIGTSSFFVIQPAKPPPASSSAIAQNRGIHVLLPVAGDFWQAGQSDPPVVRWEGPYDPNHVRVSLTRNNEFVASLWDPDAQHLCRGPTPTSPVQKQVISTLPLPVGFLPGPDYQVLVESLDGSQLGSSPLFFIMPAARRDIR